MDGMEVKGMDDTMRISATKQTSSQAESSRSRAVAVGHTPDGRGFAKWRRFWRLSRRFAAALR